MKTSINSNVIIPQQEIKLPMALVIGNDDTTTTARTTVKNHQRGWFFGVLWTLGTLVVLTIIAALLWGALRPQPAIVDYSGALGRIESKIEDGRIEISTAANSSVEAALFSKKNNDILIPVAHRVNRDGKILDRALGVTYDANGEISSVQTLDEVLMAANRAATAAEKQPTIIVRRVEAVDMTETNSRLSAIEKALAQPTTPTLERVE